MAFHLGQRDINLGRVASSPRFEARMSKPRKPRGKAVSGSTAIHFNPDDRRRIRGLQKALGGLTLAATVKWAVKQAYDRELALQKSRRLVTPFPCDNQPEANNG